MKLRTISLILSFLTTISYAQMNKFPDGVYLTYNQFKNQKPAYNTNLRIVERTNGAVFMSGGNDYKFESDIDSISRHYIKKKIYAYVRNDSIFLNCVNYNVGNWYALALTKGNFLAFSAEMTGDKQEAYSLLGGAVGAGIAAQKRYLYVLSLRTGNVKQLDKEYLEARLKEIPEFEEQYNKETDKDKESETVFLKYLELLNTKVYPYTAIPDEFNH